jgi:hypothetical protein
VGDHADPRLLPGPGSEVGLHDSIDQQHPDPIAGLVGRREEVVARLVDRVARAARWHRLDDLLARAEREFDVGVRFQEITGVP